MNGQKSSSTVTSSERALVEQLEQRVLLSETPIAATAMVEWHGLTVEAQTNSWIVSFDDYLGEQEAIAQTANMLADVGAVATEIRSVGRGRWAVFTTHANLSERVVEFVKATSDRITNIEPNRVMYADLIPNDPDLDVTWQLENTGQNIPGSGIGTPGADIGAFEAWDQTTGSPNQIVAVIDTGVDMQHPDLIANIWQNPGEIAGNGIDDDGNGFIDDVSGWDFGELDNDPDDFAGHGTAVAGTIGAVGNNGIGTVGVAWKVSILPMKIANAFGGLALDAIINAHDYLTMMRGLGVNIVASNNSYGAFQPDFFDDAGFDAERDAIQAFIDSGATFVASAGNDANNNDLNFTNYPASYPIPGIISVAASDNNDGLASFSNYGLNEVDLAAPGEQTYTTANGGGYTFISGTSFSSPITAGAVALLKAVRPQASAVEIRQALIDGVDVLPAFEGRTVSGGRLNLAKSLAAIQIPGPIVTAISPGPVVGGTVEEIVVGLNKSIDRTLFESFGTTLATVLKSGGDDTFDDGNESSIGISTVTLEEDNKTITIELATELTAETYQFTLDNTAVKDLTGNFLNGNSVAGADEVYEFKTVGVSAGGEPNDSIPLATPAFTFQASGTASVTGATIGDGVHSNLDVDIYRLQVPIGGLITAQIDAKNLQSPSSLDSYLRLFDAGGNEITANDQFNNTDSFIQFFVTTGGVYYVGVSGFPNTSYNPMAAGSGTSQSLGTYNLTVTVDLIEDDVLNFGDTLVAPVVVPDLGTLTDTIFVEDGRSVVDVNVFVDVTHTFMSDITLYLRAPDNTLVRLAGSLGGNGGGYVDTVFDDAAATSITAGAAPFTGTFKPEEVLASFNGRSAGGAWTLIIEDNAGLNAGMLNDWALEITVQNNIFGPFELNDTLSTAKTLSIFGFGGATRTGEIGDGGFGFKDVDLFKFVADPGSTLSANVTSLGILDTALRLFDAQGNQLQVANSGATRDSSITGFTFDAGGLYYLGISETSNITYNPVTAASGPAAGTTGAFNLDVSLTPGVSDAEAILSGSLLNVGVDNDGTFSASNVGIELNGAELLDTAYYGAVFNGVGFRNLSTTSPELPVSVTDQSDKGNERALSLADFNGLQMVRSVSFGSLDQFMVIDVVLTNTSGATMNDVAWMEAMNPTIAGMAVTANDVDDANPLVMASIGGGLTLAMGAADSETRAIATVVDPLLLIRDPQQVLDLGVVDPNGNSSDGILAMAYDLGDLAPGESTTMRYFVFTGEQTSSVATLYAALNAGTGSGHLTDDASTPADDADGFALLPFRLYHPEGFANKRASTFIPIVNPNSQDSRVVVIARYETGDRDELLFDGTVAAMSRDGLTITTPTLFENDTQLVRKSTPYAIEIRSELPIGATLSHFDFGVTTGESFTSQTSTTWSFPKATKGPGHSDFIIFYNPSGETIKVNTTFYPEGGGTPITMTQTLGAYRRGGWGLRFESALSNRSYGVVVTSPSPVVAAISSFDTELGGGYGSMGFPSSGALTGGLPEGQFGLNTSQESIPVLNATNTDANVEFTFLFENGSAVRKSITVVGQTINSLEVSSLANFPQGQAYSIVYESNVPVSVALPTQSFDELNGSAFTGEAHSLWLFSDGFRPGKNASQVVEYLRVFNPSDTEVLTEITLMFEDGTTSTVRATIGSRRVAEFDPHDIVPLDRRDTAQFYSVMVKAATPVVSFMGRTDNNLIGAFGTLGTPLGITDILT